jgi:hypothetical protein
MMPQVPETVQFFPSVVLPAMAVLAAITVDLPR